MSYFGVSGIYAITHEVSGKVYVGSALNIGHRWTVHRKRLSEGTHNRKLQSAWIKYGEGSFAFSVLEIVTTKENLTSREQVWIDKLCAVDKGYNVRRVAESNLGIKMSEETRAKHSMSSRDRRHSEDTKEKMRKPKSEQAKKNMRKAQKGKVVSETTREKLSKANKGRKPPSKSPEGIAALSAARKGKPQPAANLASLTASRRSKSKLTEDLIIAIRKRYVARSKTDGATAMAKEFGLSQALISMIISGKRWSLT